MSRVLNFLGYQAVWFAATGGAARGLAWPGPLTGLVYCAWQLRRSAVWRADLRLVCVALLAGAALDGMLAASGWVRYAMPAPAVPPGGAPVWILALWAAFAMTLNHSLAWLRGRIVAAALLGGIGGPLAYLAAQRLGGAVVLGTPYGATLAALAAGWALALGTLATIAARMSAR